MNPENLGPQKMAALEAELSEFSYIVSHDLATVCRHLTQFSQLLLQEAGAELNPSQLSLAGHIQTAGGRCQAMMEQLLVFSRIQQRELKLASHDARKLVQIAVLQLSEDIRASSVDLKIATDGEVYGDADLLTKAFRHLLQNAIKFRRGDALCRVSIHTARTEGGWVGRVTDNGIGLAIDHQEKAFRMFWQLSAERGKPGVGAGLAICRRIARRHGGDVRFVPQPSGACLELAMPDECHAATSSDEVGE